MPTSFSERHGIRADPSSILIGDSDGAGWTSLYVATYRHHGTAEPFETVATPYQKITLVTKGTLELASLSNGRWPSGVRRVGSIGYTPSGRVDHLRWHSLDPCFETSALYIAETFFLAAADEYRRVGSRHTREPLNGTGISEPLVAQLVAMVVAGAVAGKPELYADSAMQLLAMHVMSGESSSSTSQDSRKRGAISKHRLANVIAFMRENYMHPLSLEQLSAEAGVSPHHFAHLFKTATGLPPHRFLTNVRLEASATLLEATDKSIFTIALECGYYSASHFSEAFRRHSGKTPTDFRAERCLGK